MSIEKASYQENSTTDTSNSFLKSREFKLAIQGGLIVGALGIVAIGLSFAHDNI